MNKPSKNQLKDLVMKDVVKYIKGVWGAKDVINGVKIVEDKTFTDTINPAFYETKEYGVDTDRAAIPHTYGVLWEVKDLDVIIAENSDSAQDVTLFSRAYSNHTKQPIQIDEKLEEAVKVTDTTIISFTEKINAGYEASVSIGVKMEVVNAQASAKFTMGLELGSTQTSTKSIEKVTTAGFVMDFDVEPGIRKEVRIFAKKQVSRTLNNAIFVAHGKVYVHVQYKETDLDKTHIYILDLDEIRTSDYTFEYEVEYVVEDVRHTDYDVKIVEEPVAPLRSGDVKVIDTYPLQTMTSLHVI